MRELLILRHAKSSWDNDRLDDHDRPLNRRGERDAPRIGRLLLAESIVPERILSSTALRAITTARMVAATAGAPEPIAFEELYLAAPATYFDLLRTYGDDAARVMVVGHNPGMEDLVSQLGGRSEHFPTAALALIRLPIESWAQLPTRCPGELASVWRPKELPDEL